jgi:hypothetical protein
VRENQAVAIAPADLRDLAFELAQIEDIARRHAGSGHLTEAYQDDGGQQRVRA